MAVYKDKKPLLDTGSIKTATLSSFVVFAFFMLIVLWGLSNFFLGTYYEKARTEEVINEASVLKTQFRQDHDKFSAYAVQTASAKGIYIRMDTPFESLVFDGTRTVLDTENYAEDIARIAFKLSETSLGSVKETKNDAVHGYSRLIYASYINASAQKTSCISLPLLILTLPR